ncbi:MAG TPA: hypothetical protein VL359_14175, partial [bacterium]|nr:hypothetical protein [bacterium]
PFGQYNERVVEMVKEAGFTSARSTWPGVTHTAGGLFSLTGFVRTEATTSLVDAMNNALAQASESADQQGAAGLGNPQPGAADLGNPQQGVTSASSVNALGTVEPSTANAVAPAVAPASVPRARSGPLSPWATIDEP